MQNKILIAAGIAALGITAFAQVSARLEFTAASVRREFIDTHTPGFFNCRGVDGELFPSVGSPQSALPPTPQGRCIAEKTSLDVIIGRSFKSLPLRPHSGGLDRTVSGIPDVFLDPTLPRFQIHATTEHPSRVTKAEIQQMLQTLLIDRFKLRLRREVRQMDGYVLTVAKSGIKFKETSGTEQNPGLLSAPGTERDRVRQLGGLVPLIMKGNFRMAAIVRNLETSFLLKPVEDKTGLASLYEMTLNIQRFDRPVGGPESPRGANSGGLPPAAEFVPPMTQAFEDQLGLLLTPAKVPVEYLIVEHIEMPSEN